MRPSIRPGLLARSCVALLPLACGGEPSATRPTRQVQTACDLDALAALATNLEPASPRAQIETVWPGIRGACESIPEPAAAHFDALHEPGIAAAVDLSPLVPALCPDHARLGEDLARWPAHDQVARRFAICDFERFGVITHAQLGRHSDGLGTFALYTWLLEQGLPADEATAIARALYRLEDHASSPVVRHADLQLAKLPGQPFPDSGTYVHISRSQLQFDARQIARLRDGALAEADVTNHLVRPLFDAMMDDTDRARTQAELRGEPWDERAYILADAQTPFATIVDVMHTCGRLGYARFGLGVQPVGELEPGFIAIEAPERRAPTNPYLTRDPRGVDLDQFDPDRAGREHEAPEGVPAIMSVELRRDGMSLSRGRGSEPVEHARGDLAAIASYAEALRAEDPQARTLAISAEGDVPLQELLTAIVAARGEGCDRDPASCVLPEAIVLAGRAHAYEDLPADQVWAGPGWDGLFLVENGPGDRGLIAEYGPSAGSSPRQKLVPVVRQAPASVDGPLDPDIVRRIVRAHLPEVRSCYSVGLIEDPSLAGRVAIEFVVAAKGKVHSSKVSEDTLAADAVAKCVAKAVKRWKFPAPSGGAEVRIVYPFELSPG